MRAAANAVRQETAAAASKTLSEAKEALTEAQVLRQDLRRRAQLLQQQESDLQRVLERLGTDRASDQTLQDAFRERPDHLEVRPDLLPGSPGLLETGIEPSPTPQPGPMRRCLQWIISDGHTLTEMIPPRSPDEDGHVLD